MNKVDANVINTIPDEILERIFKVLSPKSITLCRAVCRRWLQVVDCITTNDKLWRNHCEMDYSDICHSAYKTSIPSLNWYHLYKSLALWVKLPHFQETRTELIGNYSDPYISCQVLPDGVIGFLTITSVVYYSVNTLQQLPELTIADNDDYFVYKENADVILLLNIQHKLLIRRKENRNEIVNTFDKVSTFDILENNIYYVTFEYDIFQCFYIDGSYASTKLLRFPKMVMSIMPKNGILYIWTPGYRIYSFVNNILLPVSINGSIRDKLERLKQWNFANNSDQKYLHRLLSLYNYEQQKKTLNEEMIMIRIHGPILIAGYNNFTLRIFHSLYNTSVFDLLKSKPIKVLHLLKPQDDTLSCSNMNAVVLEGKHSHTVVVSIETKIVVFKFTDLLYSEKPSPSIDNYSVCSGVQSSIIGSSTSSSCQSISCRKSSISSNIEATIISEK